MSTGQRVVGTGRWVVGSELYVAVVEAESCPTGLLPRSSDERYTYGSYRGWSWCVQLYLVRVRVRVRVKVRVRVRVSESSCTRSYPY